MPGIYVLQALAREPQEPRIAMARPGIYVLQAERRKEAARIAAEQDAAESTNVATERIRPPELHSVTAASEHDAAQSMSLAAKPSRR